MPDTKKIKTALVSVYYKDKLDKIVNKLNELGVEIISTGLRYRRFGFKSKRSCTCRNNASYHFRQATLHC